jgi:hypothetical protein
MFDDTPPPSFTVVSRDGVIDVDRIEGVNIRFDTDQSRRGYRVVKHSTLLQKLVNLHAPSAVINNEQRQLARDMMLDSELPERNADVAELVTKLMKDTKEDRLEYLPRPDDELAYITAGAFDVPTCVGYATAIIDRYYELGLRFRVRCWNVLDQTHCQDSEGNHYIPELDYYDLFFSAPMGETKGKMDGSPHCVGFTEMPDWVFDHFGPGGGYALPEARQRTGTPPQYGVSQPGCDNDSLDGRNIHGIGLTVPDDQTEAPDGAGADDVDLPRIDLGAAIPEHSDVTGELQR